MQQRHFDRKQYFNEQIITTKKYVIPFIEKVKSISVDSKVLEIGCGEGGNIVPFLERGCSVVGIDLYESQIENAKKFTREYFFYKKIDVQFICQNIYDTLPNTFEKFDVIIIRDVIEHIVDQEKFMKFIKNFINDDGVIFFGFPPWRMPFGGHQQMCRNNLLSKLPYYHLLPKWLYRWVLKIFREEQTTIQGLLEIKQTGISIRRFRSIIKNNGYKVKRNIHFLFNPNYEIKFGLKPKKVSPFFNLIPYFKDYYTTCCYYVIGLK